MLAKNGLRTSRLVDANGHLRKVTDEGVKKLQEALPNCKIHR